MAILTPIPPLRIYHPAFSAPEHEWIKPGASAVWTDQTGREHHVAITGTVRVEPNKEVGGPQVFITFYRSRHVDWAVPASSLRPDSLANLLTAIISLENFDEDGCLRVKLSDQDLNGLEAIIRFARDERTAGALDRIVVIAESILKRYRVNRPNA